VRGRGAAAVGPRARRRSPLPPHGFAALGVGRGGRPGGPFAPRARTPLRCASLVRAWASRARRRGPRGRDGAACPVWVPRASATTKTIGCHVPAGPLLKLSQLVFGPSLLGVLTIELPLRSVPSRKLGGTLQYLCYFHADPPPGRGNAAHFENHLRAGRRLAETDCIVRGSETGTNGPAGHAQDRGGSTGTLTPSGSASP